MNAKETRLTAGRWSERSKCPDWTEADQAALNTWLIDPAHMVAFLRVEAMWQNTDRLKALRRPAPMRAQKISTANKLWPILRKTAASLIGAAIVAAIAWQQFNAPSETTYATAIGEHKTITFTDGTHVELNTNSVLRVSKKNERKVWLDKGEAYFKIVHNAANPFIVISDGRKVTDLGTKFAVRQDKDSLRVSVVEGLVDVEAKDKNPQSLLKPGEILTATKQNQSITRKPLQTIIASLDWKHGKLFFDYATLAEAAAEFNRYNSTKLVIKDPDVARMTIVGTYNTKNIGKFINATTELFGLKAETSESQIILSR